MFDKIQMILMIKTSRSNNSISRLNKKKLNNVLFLFSRSSTFRILEACYGLFRINTLLEAERLLEGRLLIEGVFIGKKSQKRGRLFKGAFNSKPYGKYIKLSKKYIYEKFKNLMFELNWYFFILLVFLREVFDREDRCINCRSIIDVRLSSKFVSV